MHVLTLEWIQKAEGDYMTALRESRARKSPNFDAVCFHAQQCAEKYLKAFLQEQEHYFPPTHKLILLLEMCLEHEASLEFQREFLQLLDRYAIKFRYPGENAIRSDAKEAVKAMIAVRAYLRSVLSADE